MIWLLVPLAILLTYVVSSDVLWLSLRRWLGPESQLDPHGLFWLSRGAGPVAISLAVYYAFLFFPDRSPAVYVAVVLSLLVLGGFYGRRQVLQLAETYRSIWRDARSFLSADERRLPALVAAVFALLGIVFAVAYPIVEHDSLSATIEARIMARDFDMGNYLRVKAPDPQTGYYMENFRTPFLQMIYVWFSLLCGRGTMDLLARTVSPFYALFCLFLLAWAVHRQRSRGAAVWSVFLLAATPIFFYMSYNNGIDTARLYLSFAALVWVGELSCRPVCYRLASVTAVFAGFAVYCHLLSVPAMVGGYLVFLASRGTKIRRKLIATLVIAVVSPLAAAQIHYLSHPGIAAQLDRSLHLDLSQIALLEKLRPTLPEPEQTPDSAVGEAQQEQPVLAQTTPGGEKPAAAATRLEESPRTAVERFQAILEIRGQGSDSISTWIFGRLQMFTGIEYFGLLFYFFWIGLVAWWRRDEETTAFDRVLVGAALLTAFIVLSGVRKLSWSNPRYIASILVIAAYFAGPYLVSVESWVRRRLGASSRLVIWALVAIMTFPVVLVTSIRGAKVEITNPGTFYQDFRSLEWLDYSLEDPLGALGTFWEKYFGIRDTIRFFAADDATKLRHSHDYFAAVQYANRALPEDARILVFRDARFFYYGERYGVVWYSPENVPRSFHRARNAAEMLRHLAARGYTHVISDEYTEKRPGFVDTRLASVLENPRYAEKVFEYGIVDIYRLRYE